MVQRYRTKEEKWGFLYRKNGKSRLRIARWYSREHNTTRLQVLRDDANLNKC